MLARCDAKTSSEHGTRHPYEELCSKIRLLEAGIQEFESFSCIISHDLKSSLLAIEGCTSLLERKHSEHLDEDARQLIRLIHDTCQRTTHGLEDLLTYARLGCRSIKSGEIDMAQLAQEASSQVLCDYSGTLPNIIMGRLPPVRGDQSLLYQVWVNLVGNAVKYSSKVASPRIESAGWVSELETVYAIRDNGAGFDIRFAEKLFELFQRLHSKSDFPGTGIGLASVKRIVSSHGGRVWAQSQPNNGATFSFSVPHERVVL